MGLSEVQQVLVDTTILNQSINKDKLSNLNRPITLRGENIIKSLPGKKKAQSQVIIVHNSSSLHWLVLCVYFDTSYSQQRGRSLS